jgi:cyclin G2
MAEKLYKTLKSLLELEKRHIQEKTIVMYELQSSDYDVGDMRDVTVAWLANTFQRTPHSLVLAVNYLDRFLAAVKVQPKYIKCVAAACYFIAAKVVCEKEVSP